MAIAELAAQRQTIMDLGERAMAEQTTTIRFQLEAALHAADQAEMHAVAALIAQALDLLVSET